MTPDNFRIAMLNSLRVGPYDAPHQTNAPVEEWLIAERRGPAGEYLIISDTATPVARDTQAAPDNLSEQNSIFAILAENSADRPQFLMLRHLPAGVTVPGRFFPADGMAVVHMDGSKLQLTAIGRHAHSRGSVDGESVLYDVPHPAPNAEGALNWHFLAQQQAWTPSR
ncbi:hypothetical protein D4A92_22975 (plasmid) [Rhizobium rosettiformans]|uniref:Uncharacterized protein n=1 Tax=Rhizobium rosettiformans TaxID=1368430 RepID=A0ABX7F4S0_9HYPH|nr:hypothetical protein [Rhizobium rosettiformans]QRF54381.1 hypothetical protein D4A92_22975 [Rhizobium rosettiformans]